MNFKQNTTLGALFGALSAFSYAAMCVFVKQASSDLPLSELIFARFAVSLLALLPWILVSKDFTLKTKDPLKHFIRVTTGVLALFCSFYAIHFIPLVDALLLSNTNPLFIPVLCWMMFGMKTTKKALFGNLLGFLGILIVLRPNDQVFSPPALIALFAGFCLAIAMVYIRLLSKTNSPLQILFYYFAVSTLISGILTIMVWKTPQNLNLWLILLGIGITGTLFQIFATFCYAMAPVRLMSNLTFLAVPFGAVCDWLIWGVIPSAHSIVGGILVIIGAILTVYYGQKEMILKVHD